MNHLFGLTLDPRLYGEQSKAVKQKVFDIGKNSAADKEIVLEMFSASKWKDLSEAKKSKHSVFHCHACKRDDSLRSALALFPIRKNDIAGKKRAEEGGLYRPSQEEVQKETIETVRQLNSQYRTEYGTTFDAQYRQCKGLETKAVVS